MGEVDNLKLDYEQTAAQFRSFADARFKLLAVVPMLAGYDSSASHKTTGAARDPGSTYKRQRK